MVLTSQAHRRRATKRNRRISTIPAGNIDAGPVSVSTVDTRPRRSESGVLAAWPGASVTGPAAPLPDRRLRRVPVVMVGCRFRFESRSESAQVGLLHEGRDLLAKGCAYCTKAPPTRSTPNPPPVAPHLRAVHPDDDGSPSPAGRSSTSPTRQTQPTSVSDVMTSETLRSHETTQCAGGTTTRFYVRPGGIAYDHVPRDPDEESPAQPHPHDTKNPF